MAYQQKLARYSIYQLNFNRHPDPYYANLPDSPIPKNSPHITKKPFPVTFSRNNF